MDALNRTIEGLEARIEGLMAQNGHRGHGGQRDERYHPAPYSGQVSSQRNQFDDPLSSIRARQEQLSGGTGHPSNEPRGAFAERVREPAYGYQPQSAHQSSGSTALGRDGFKELADSISEMRRDLKAEIQENLTRELAAIRHEVRDLTADSRQMGLSDDLSAEIASISARIERLGDGGGNVSALRLELESMRSMLGELAREESVQALHGRWQSVEDHVAGLDINGVRDDLVKLAHRIDDIRDAVSTMPASAVSSELEGQIGRISNAVEALASRSEIPASQFEDHFGLIAARLEEVAQAVVTLQERQTLPFDAETFRQLESRINVIAKKMGGMEIFNLAADVGGRLDAVSERMGHLADEETVSRLDERLAQLQEMLETGAGGAPSNGSVLPELAQNIADLSGKLDRAGGTDINEQLAFRLDDLVSRIDSLQSAASQSGEIPANVIGRLEALIGRVEDTANRNPDPLPGMQSLEARLADISARLDQPQVATGEAIAPDLTGLEERLNDISAKLDRAGSTSGSESDEALRGLEAQISNLSQLIASSPSAQGLDRLDSRLGEIAEHMATNDEYIIEAARQAAESALAAYAAQHGVSGSGAGSAQPANMEIITALADDLKALEALSRQSEDRSVRALEGVQETLLKIAAKMEQLDNARSNPAAEGGYSAMPKMPKADTDVFDQVLEEDLTADDYAEDHHLDNGNGDRGQRSPAEAAALAAAYASVDDDIEAPSQNSKPSKAAKKSLLAGLTSKIMAKSKDDDFAAEPRFTDSDPPPLEPELGLDDSNANLPLEPGSGAPDINRILQRVRESQVGSSGANTNSGSTEGGEFLASARRAAMAAAAEVETIGKSANTKSGKSGMLDIIKSKRRPILMAVGAVLLVVMTLPMIKGFLGSDSAPKMAEAPVVMNEPVQPVISDKIVEPIETEVSEAATANAELPQVRVVELPPQGEVANVQNAEVTEMAAGTDVAEPIAPLVETTPVAEIEAALMADLNSLPEGLLSADLRKAAEDLNPLAFYEIGARFTEGRGTSVDLDRATIWYQRAADLGHAPSQYRLANFYEKGSGVTRDLDAAKKWYQLAAEQGNASAMHNLAVLYATAGSVPDFDSSAQWFVKAAELGVRDSQVNLAILYARGDGLDRDLEQSYKWFAIAANEGDKDAAGKRDEVYNALRPEQADKARELVANWKAQPLIEQANSVEVPANWSGVETRTASVDMSKAVRNIQAILNNNGFDAGKPDGVMGAKTVSAIKSFQIAEGVEPTGEVTDDLVRRLLDLNK